MTFKPVADLYLITYEDGKPYRYTRDAEDAVDAINAGFKVEEFVSLENHRAALLHGKAEPVSQHPDLTVWYGSMPESNGKSNWTAILHRKGECLSTGITIDRSEYPERVRYEADRVRHIIGELKEQPDILAYDTDAHSGYVKPVNSPAAPGGWVLVPVKPTPEMLRAIMEANQNQRGSLATYSRLLAAAPQQEVK